MCDATSDAGCAAAGTINFFRPLSTKICFQSFNFSSIIFAGMNYRRLTILLLFWGFVLPVFSQQDSVLLENSAVVRKFYFRRDSAGFFTAAFVNKASGKIMNPGTEEFNITVNDSLLNGKIAGICRIACRKQETRLYQGITANHIYQAFCATRLSIVRGDSAHQETCWRY